MFVSFVACGNYLTRALRNVKRVFRECTYQLAIYSCICVCGIYVHMYTYMYVCVFALMHAID